MPRLAPCLFVAAACGHAPAVLAPPAAIAPTELRVPGVTEYRAHPMFLADRIYVLGMSRDRIAYLNDPADEACGCYTPEVVIQDLRSDAIVWKDSYDSGELDPANTTQLQNLDQLWRARGADWEHHLQEQGVPRDPVPPLATLPTGGTTVPRFEIHTEQIDDPELGYVHLTSYRIDLVTDDGAHEIATSPPSPDHFNLLHVEVAGYVPARDPDGDAAVLILENHRGWEGTPTVNRLRFVGADIHPDGR